MSSDEQVTCSPFVPGYDESANVSGAASESETSVYGEDACFATCCTVSIVVALLIGAVVAFVLKVSLQ